MLTPKERTSSKTTAAPEMIDDLTKGYKKQPEKIKVLRRQSTGAQLYSEALVSQKKSQNFGLPMIASGEQRTNLRCQAAVKLLSHHHRSAAAATRLGALMYEILISNELYRAKNKEASLTLPSCRQLCRDAEMRKYGVGQTVFKKGDRGSGMYLVLEGEASVHIGGEVMAVLGPGNSFGELSLILDQARSATIVSKKQCTLMFIPRSTYVTVLKEQQDAQFADRAEFLSKLSMFKNTPKEKLKTLNILFKDAKFPGAHVVWKGNDDTMTDAVYFIRSGTCELRWYKKSLAEGGTLDDPFYRVCQLGPYQCFGDITFAIGRDPHVVVVTKTRCELWRLPFTRVEQLGEAKDILTKNAILKVQFQKRRIKKLKKNENMINHLPFSDFTVDKEGKGTKQQGLATGGDESSLASNPKSRTLSPSFIRNAQRTDILGQQKYRFAKHDARVQNLPTRVVVSLVDDFNYGNPKFDAGTRRLANLLNKHAEQEKNRSIATPQGRKRPNNLALPAVSCLSRKNLQTTPMVMSPMRGSFYNSPVSRMKSCSEESNVVATAVFV